MAVRNIPSGCYAQPGSTDALDSAGVRRYSSDVKGSYSDLVTWMDTFTLGVDTYDGHIIRERSIRRVAGNLGVLTITTGDGDTVDNVQTAYKGVWSFHAARNDKSVMAYCGSAAGRIHVEMWQKETDSTLADAGKYKDDDGTVHELNDAEYAIAQKIAQGKESVIRFYPVLTFTSYYKTCPRNWGVDIGLIRTPESTTATSVIAPANINSVISGFVWLNVQDDVDEMPDGNFKRVQSWWGVREDDGGWDTDFYGPNRWPMPITSNT